MILLIYLLIINAVAFASMLIDKIKARKNLWRIPEATLLTFAILGGSLGAYAGMQLFRHKTKHPKFSFGLPVILAVHIMIGVLLVAKGIL